MNSTKTKREKKNVLKFSKHKNDQMETTNGDKEIRTERCFLKVGDKAIVVVENHMIYEKKTPGQERK